MPRDNRKKRVLSPSPELETPTASSTPPVPVLSHATKKRRADGAATPAPPAEHAEDMTPVTPSTMAEPANASILANGDATPATPAKLAENVSPVVPSTTAQQANAMPTPLLGMEGGVLTGDVDADATKITTLTREYIVEPTITRLNRMLDYANTSNNTFSLRTLPDYSELKWGSGSTLPKDGNARYLCRNDKPLNVWIIGELRSFKTKDYKMKPYIYNANRVYTGVAPFHGLDRDLARKVLAFFAQPGAYDGAPGQQDNLPGEPAPNDDVIYAGKWMSDYGMDPADVPAFTNCFNATTKWPGAKNAGHLKTAPNKLTSPDVVLVEAGIKRRFVTEKHNGVYKTKFDEWTVDFELRRVALLLKAPQPEVQFEDNEEDFEI